MTRNQETPVEGHGGPDVERLAMQLRGLSREEFRTQMEDIADGVLGYLRYELGWDPDPRKSTWQAIEINRLLTKRMARREAFPLWVGIVVSGLLGLAGLLVALVKHSSP